ncbi:aminotransferase class V-fold PLP-dependent enzyme [Bdellovibrio sp. HCB337]|uniref:aminotransferase class V-fold PLP-dependent enzyme n=1 Tax=Bdellovibrio sp. HCB337 TaxID=3394358 RepID=UPI0039A75E08
MKKISEAGVQAVSFKEQPWRLQPSDFFTGCDELRSLVANLLKGKADNVALIPAVSYGVETAVVNLPLKAGQKVLIPEGEFPSNVYPWQSACAEVGAEIVFVPRPATYDWAEAFISAIDEKTAVVSVPQTDWSDGSHFDLVRISQKAKAVGAALVVDISQSFGVSPIDIRSFDPDFLFSVGYKWQLGPYGVSYMYVADRHLNGKPLENNWVNRRSSEDFTRLTEYTNEYQVGARRFDSGQHSNFALNPMAIEAMKTLNEITPEKIFAHITGLNDVLVQGLNSSGFEVVPAHRRTGHMIGARGPAGLCVKDLCGRLREKDIYVSVRCNSLRISPHIYNTKEDIEKLLRELKRLLHESASTRERQLNA